MRRGTHMRMLIHAVTLTALVPAAAFQVAAQELSGNTAVSQGVSVFYDAKGTGAPVVLLHGLGLNREMWDPQVDAFAREFRVVRVDFPGAGRSGPVTGPISFTTAAADVIRAIGAGPVHVIGLSNGGQIAVDLALTSPELVRSLVLVDAAVAGFRFSQDMLARIRNYAAIGREQSVAQANAAYLTDPLFAAAGRDPGLAKKLSEIVLPYSGEYWLHANWRSPVRPPAITRLEEIKAPTLVLVGALDIPDFQALADTLARRVPGARRAVIEGAGHMSNMEKPNEFNRVVLDFLRGLNKE